MRARTTAAAAGFGYAFGVAIENQEVFSAPVIGDPAAEIRAHYADQAFAIVGWSAGALALISYAAFAILIYRLLRSAGSGGRWAAAGLVGGLAGPLLAAAGLVASSNLVFDLSGQSDDRVSELFDFAVGIQLWAAVFVALFMIGYGVAARRSGAWPAWLAQVGIAIGAVALLGPVAALTESDGIELTVRVAFAAQALWITVLSLWLAFGGQPALDFARRSAFLVLAIAAGGIGIALLATPDATGTFFAWGLKPEALAAFAGGVYVGSAALYAIALPADARATRGLVAGAVMLSVSVLIVTLTHLDQFDLDRAQAWAWLVLFAGFSALTITLLLAGGGEERTREGLAPWARLVLGAVAALLGALALALWIDPTGLAGPSPYELPPLGGRFAGSWAATLAVITGWAAYYDDPAQGRLAGLGLVLLPGGVAIAGLRTLGELEPDSATAAYLAALAALVALGVSIAISTGRQSR